MSQRPPDAQRLAQLLDLLERIARCEQQGTPIPEAELNELVRWSSPILWGRFSHYFVRGTDGHWEQELRAAWTLCFLEYPLIVTRYLSYRNAAQAKGRLPMGPSQYFLLQRTTSGGWFQRRLVPSAIRQALDSLCKMLRRDRCRYAPETLLLKDAARRESWWVAEAQCPLSVNFGCLKFDLRRFAARDQAALIPSRVRIGRPQWDEEERLLASPAWRGLQDRPRCMRTILNRMFDSIRGERFPLRGEVLRNWALHGLQQQTAVPITVEAVQCSPAEAARRFFVNEEALAAAARQHDEEEEEE